MTLEEFFDELDQAKSPVALERLVALMKNLEVDRGDLAGAVQFSPNHYKRNLLHLGEDYAALVLCWAAGQRSPIHDHRGSCCGVRVVTGTATEQCFTLASSGQLEPSRRSQLSAPGVCGSFDGDIHEVRNDSSDEDLITLHVYTPPLNVYQVFDPKTGKRSKKEDLETKEALLLKQSLKTENGRAPA